MKFYAFLTATVVVISPGICLMWVFLMAEINWHDALDVTTLVAVVWMIRGMRREDQAAERAIRRITARRMTRHERSGFEDSFPPFEADAWESLTPQV